MLVGVADFPAVLIHAYTYDMDVRIVRVTVFIDNVRLVPISHPFHVPCRQLLQLRVGQTVFRRRAESDMQDRFFGVAVCQQVVLEREERKAQGLLPRYTPRQ